MIKTKNLSIIKQWLNDGKAILFPTDTVFGLICKKSLTIYKIKKRDKSKKLIKFINSIDKIKTLSPKEKSIINKYWPGGLTIIKNKTSYRCPKHNKLLSLLNNYEFLYSSSANISGNSPITNFKEAIKEFNDSPLILFADFSHKTTKPSTIINLDNYTVVRNGVINGEKILWQIKNQE